MEDKGRGQVGLGNLKRTRATGRGILSARDNTYGARKGSENKFMNAARQRSGARWHSTRALHPTH